ncbi:spore germination protein [Alkaliphilus sp. MSJ-5]|uniref:Spore germination protein n=1 Tax=Alkaliphilus flagellatus TaxID=2841507 RepID=A0ABS6G378_9FIRM|nr:spore germination protein [Alkaliphilus flagellatus]MBU5676093.1 spore germination protein [Alkaliphilus flagellatus]
MSLWESLFGKKSENENIKPEETKVGKSLDENLESIKNMLIDCDDIVYRNIKVGTDESYRATLIYIDGMADKNLLNDYVLKNLMVSSRITPPNAKVIKKELSNILKDKTLTVSEMKEVETIEQGILDILSGDTVLILDDYEKLIIIASKGWDGRSISQPETESVIRGPREGFVETIRVNTALIRRRIRDHKLKIKGYKIGKRSQSDVCVMYIEDIVNQDALKEVDKRLSAIDIDAIIDSGYIEQLIEDNWRSPFPQIQITERPDVASAALYEGKIAIIVDNSPFSLIVPATLNAMMQSAEDYYERWGIATFIRILRYIGAAISLYAPALYIAVTAFHPQMLPSKLSMSIAANRAGVPFPSVIEAIIMEITLEILREAGVRLPGPIGATIGIVGGLVVGQAAVEAGIVGPIMVIVVAITAISSFAIPSYSMAIGLRLLRFLLIIVSATLGLYGIMLGTILILAHLCSLKSFGVPYLAPYTTYIRQSTDLKDTFIKAPLPSMHNRDTTANKNQSKRMQDRREEDLDKEE